MAVNVTDKLSALIAQWESLRPGRVEPVRGTGTSAPVTPRATPIAPPPGMPTSAAPITVNVTLPPVMITSRELAQHQTHFAVLQAGGPAFR